MVKNLLVGDDVTYERKIREMIVASRVESTLSKPEILELYLNSAYLGRGAWGVEMAARSYFGKSAQDLTIGEGAMLAGLLKGPSFFNPDRHPDRAKERLAYVLGRMQEDGVITAEQKNRALGGAAPSLLRSSSGGATAACISSIFSAARRRTDGVAEPDGGILHRPFDHQHGLAARSRNFSAGRACALYEMSNGRAQFRGPEANIGDAIQKLTASGGGAGALPAWQQALQAVRLPLPTCIGSRPLFSKGRRQT